MFAVAVSFAVAAPTAVLCYSLLLLTAVCSKQAEMFGLLAAIACLRGVLLATAAAATVELCAAAVLPLTRPLRTSKWSQAQLRCEIAVQHCPTVQPFFHFFALFLADRDNCCPACCCAGWCCCRALADASGPAAAQGNFGFCLLSLLRSLSTAADTSGATGRPVVACTGKETRVTQLWRCPITAITNIATP